MLRMALPDILEIQPTPAPVRADLVVPGSKSLTNRALILAALRRGMVRLEGALWSEDTEHMVDCLRRLGFSVTVERSAAEPSNRCLEVEGMGGRVPPGGTRQAPLELFVGNAGTAARFLTALVCLGEGWYRLDGVSRMRERPQSGLLQALRSLGYRVESDGDTLPLLIEGGGRRPGKCLVDTSSSSQFASALLLAGEFGGWDLEEVGGPSPYVTMTRELLQNFPRNGGTYVIEPDASGGSYFWGLSWLWARHFGASPSVQVQDWPSSGWQIDAEMPRLLLGQNPAIPEVVSRSTDLGDAIMTAVVLAPWNPRSVQFTDLGRLRLQECERVAALRTELTRCGAQVEEKGDCLTVHPGPLHGADIQTYEDHRMAMCFGMIGTVVPGIRIHHPGCVAKTFPNFFDKLALPTPEGLGLTLLDGDGRRWQPIASTEALPQPH